MKTIYMHIGTCKTGTSALQNFFYENANILAEYGINYPIQYGGVPYTDERLTSGNIELIICNVELTNEQKALKIVEMAKEYDNILVSCEVIWILLGREEGFFETFVNLGIDLKIIVYLRRQEEYLESMMRQEVKGDCFISKSEEWGEFEPDRISDEQDRLKTVVFEESAHYLQVLNSIEKKIGSNNVIVRRYQKETFMGGNIYSDFLNVLGIELNERFSIPKKKFNLSLDNSTLELKRLINVMNRDNPEREIINVRYLPLLLQLVSEKENKEVSQLTVKQVEKIRKRFEQENKKIASKFLGKEEDLFIYPPINCLGKFQLCESELIKDSIKLMSKILKLDEETSIQLLNNLIGCLEKNIDEITQSQIQKQDLDRQLYSLQEEINAMKNGYSWKITAPLRKVYRTIKRAKEHMFGGGG